MLSRQRDPCGVQVLMFVKTDGARIADSFSFLRHSISGLSGAMPKCPSTSSSLSPTTATHKWWGLLCSFSVPFNSRPCTRAHSISQYTAILPPESTMQLTEQIRVSPAIMMHDVGTDLWECPGDQRSVGEPSARHTCYFSSARRTTALRSGANWPAWAQTIQSGYREKWARLIIGMIK